MRCLLALMHLAGVGLASTPAVGQVEMGEPLDFGFAGVKLAVPKGSVLRTPDKATTVLHAVRFRGGKPVLSIKLAAFRRPADGSLDELVGDSYPKGTERVILRGFKVVKTISMKVAGLDARVRIVCPELFAAPPEPVEIPDLPGHGTHVVSLTPDRDPNAGAEVDVAVTLEVGEHGIREDERVLDVRF